jgi:hypothetical protein
MKKYFVTQEKLKEFFNDGSEFTMENPETLIGMHMCIYICVYIHTHL